MLYNGTRTNLSFLVTSGQLAHTVAVRLLSFSLPNSTFFFSFSGMCVVVVVVNVCGCDVKLLLGRITFDLSGHDENCNLVGICILPCTFQQAARFLSSTCFPIDISSHFLVTTVISLLIALSFSSFPVLVLSYSFTVVPPKPLPSILS